MLQAPRYLNPALGLVYRNPHPVTLSFLNFILNVARGPLRWPVGLFQLPFSTLAETSSYATGLQLNFHINQFGSISTSF